MYVYITYLYNNVRLELAHISSFSLLSNMLFFPRVKSGQSLLPRVPPFLMSHPSPFTIIIRHQLSSATLKNDFLFLLIYETERILEPILPVCIVVSVKEFILACFRWRFSQRFSAHNAFLSNSTNSMQEHHNALHWLQFKKNIVRNGRRLYYVNCLMTKPVVFTPYHYYMATSNAIHVSRPLYRY